MGGFWYALVGRLIPSTIVGAVPRTRIMKRMSRTTLFATLVTTLSIVAVLVMPIVEAAPLRLQFQQTWGGPNSEIANGIAIGTDGNLYLAGQTNSFGAGGLDAFLLKFTPGDTLLWQHTGEQPTMSRELPSAQPLTAASTSQPRPSPLEIQATT